jgi:hypothetical protein
MGKITEHEGEAVLVIPTEYIESMTTSMGDTAAVKADYVVLSGENKDEEYSDQLIFPKALVSRLTAMARYNEVNPEDPKTGHPRMLLGRIGKGEAKKGQSAPWIFEAPTEADATAAREWLAKKNEPQDPFAS